MYHLELNDEERQSLAEMLDEAITALRLEVADTHRAEYRAMLKHREQDLKRLRAALEPHTHGQPA